MSFAPGVSQQHPQPSNKHSYKRLGEGVSQTSDEAAELLLFLFIFTITTFYWENILVLQKGCFLGRVSIIWIYGFYTIFILVMGLAYFSLILWLCPWYTGMSIGASKVVKWKVAQTADNLLPDLQHVRQGWSGSQLVLLRYDGSIQGPPVPSQK